MKQLLGYALLLAILAAGVNDVGRYLTSSYNLDTVTSELAQYAYEQAAATGGGQPQVGSRVAALAAQRGVSVTAYDQTASAVTVYTQDTVEGTLLWARLSALASGKPSTEPLYVKDRESRNRD